MRKLSTFTGKKGLDLCKEHMLNLETLVTECESRFIS